MGWHDNLADRAAAMGKTAIEFRSAAQRKADATWVLLIIVGVIWFFLNWLWALIPAALAGFSAFRSVSASLIATRLEKVEVRHNSSETTQPYGAAQGPGGWWRAS